MKKLLTIVVLIFLFSSIGYAKEMVLQCKPSKIRMFDINKNNWIFEKSNSDQIYKINYKKRKSIEWLIIDF